MQSILLVALLATLSLGAPLDQQWKLWKETNNKRYSNAEEHLRYERYNSLIDHFEHKTVLVKPFGRAI